MAEVAESSSSAASAPAHFRTGGWELAVVVVLGSALRIWHFAGARSLWQDEVWRALNIVDRSFAELFGRLDYDQMAPIGWLVAERALFLLVGTVEHGLRLLPLVAGLLALALTAVIARQLLPRSAAFLATALFAFSPSLVFFSAEVKQYSTDVAVSAVLCLTGIGFLRARRLAPPSVMLFAAFGVLALTLSHPAVFVLAGIGGALAIDTLRRRDWRGLVMLAAVAAIWLCMFFLVYQSGGAPLLGNAARQVRHWDLGMPPWRVNTAALSWYVDHFFFLFSKTLRLPAAALAGLLFLAGTFHWFRRDRIQALLLYSPLALAFVAALLHKYPFEDRLLLFFAPQLCLGIGAGFAALKLEGWRNGVAKVVVSMLLLVEPVQVLAREYAKPRPFEREDYRTPLAVVSKEFRPGDVLYVGWRASAGFNLYARCFNFNGIELVGERGNRQTLDYLLADIEMLRRRPRVWALFFNQTGSSMSNDALVFSHASRVYGRVRSVGRYEGTELLLVDFEAPAVGADVGYKEPTQPFSTGFSGHMLRPLSKHEPGVASMCAG